MVGRQIERFLLLLSGAGTPGRGMETYMRFPVYMIPMIARTQEPIRAANNVMDRRKALTLAILSEITENAHMYEDREQTTAARASCVSSRRTAGSAPPKSTLFNSSDVPISLKVLVTPSHASGMVMFQLKSSE